MEKWLGHEFHNSTTNETGFDKRAFGKFCTEFKKFINANTPDEIKVVSLSKGFYYFSGFMHNEKTDKYAYFSISDTRFMKDEWHRNLLIRTAKGTSDYSGGQNHYTKLENLYESVQRLIG